MADEGLIRFIEEAFKSRFGEDVVGVSSRTLIPHEAFVQVRVKAVGRGMDALGQALTEEFDELGRRVTIQIQGPRTVRRLRRLTQMEKLKAQSVGRGTWQMRERG